MSILSNLCTAPTSFYSGNFARACSTVLSLQTSCLRQVRVIWILHMHLSISRIFRMELEVRFELTRTFVSRLQGECNRPLCDSSIFNCIRKYINASTDLRHTSSFKNIINIHSREAEQWLATSMLLQWVHRVQASLTQNRSAPRVNIWKISPSFSINNVKLSLS